MSEQNNKRNIFIEEQEDVTVVRGGVRVEFTKAGSITVYGDVSISHEPQNKAGGRHRKPRLKVGDVMENRTVYAGKSPNTGKAMYACPKDARLTEDACLTMRWSEAMDYADRFEGYGYRAGTFRVPTDDELDVLFNHRAKIGGFNETGFSRASCYWSSTPSSGFKENSKHAYNQWFSDGDQSRDSRDQDFSVRLVCD